MPEARASRDPLPKLVKRKDVAASGRPLGPEAFQQRRRATAALVLGLSSILFFPSAGPLVIVLAPFAWWLGAKDRRDLAKQSRTESATGYVGRLLGAWITFLFLVVPAAIGLLALSVSLMSSNVRL